MLFAQIGQRSGVRRRRFKQIKQCVPGAQSDHVISGFDLAFLLQGQTQRFSVEALHGRKLLCHQSDVVETLVSKHTLFCRFGTAPCKTFPRPYHLPYLRVWVHQMLGSALIRCCLAYFAWPTIFWINCGSSGSRPTFARRGVRSIQLWSMAKTFLNSGRLSSTRLMLARATACQ